MDAQPCRKLPVHDLRLGQNALAACLHNRYENALHLDTQ